MHFSVMDVTPEMASTWLKRNTKNRTISQDHVSRLADQMLSGRWCLNGQTISFDTVGRLLDGQHRLSAVIKSGVAVRMAVATGVVDPEAFKTYDDIMLKRGATQIARMMGLEKNQNYVVAAARIIDLYEQCETIEDFGKLVIRKPPQSSSYIAEKSVQIASEIETVRSIIPSAIIKHSSEKSLVIGMAVIFNRVDPVSTFDFFNRIQSGFFQGEHDPCLQLRDRMMTGRATGMSGADWKKTIAAIMIKSFNAFRKNQTIGTLRWRIKGESPEKFPRIDGSGK